MSIRGNVSLAIRTYKTANRLSLSALAELLEIPVSSLQCYLKGTSDLRADTIELLAEKMSIPVIEMVSGPVPGAGQAETIVRAARELADLTEDRREHGIGLFLQLVALFAGDT